MKIRIRHFVVFLIVVLSLTFTGCGVPQKDYDDLQAQLDQAQKDNVAAKSQLSSVQKDFDTTKAQLSKDYDTTKSKLDSAQSEITKLQGTIDSQSNTLKQTQAEVSLLENKLDTILDTELTQYYRVNYQTFHYEWDLPVSLRSYFDNKEKTRPSEIGTMVTNADTTIDALVRSIKDSSLTNNLRKSDVINLVAKLIQSLPLTDKDVSTPYDGYPRYPLETLVEQSGDSQDTSILAAALLTRLEYDVVFLSFGAPKHMAIGVYMPGTGGYSWEYQGKRYYYLETTGEGWPFGDTPTQYRENTPIIIPIGS